MAFGFGKGKMKLDINQTDFVPGDVIKGNITLDLKKPITANELKIKVYGCRKIDRHGSSGTSRAVIPLSEKNLDGNHEYDTKTYSFELKIPEDTMQRSKDWVNNLPEGVARNMFLKMESEGRVRDYYYIEAILDIPRGLDLKDEIQINIVDRS